MLPALLSDRLALAEFMRVRDPLTQDPAFP